MKTSIIEELLPYVIQFNILNDKLNRQPMLNKPIFDEPSHTYINSIEGYLYTSVTTLVGKYKEKFDDNYWSLYNAGRRLLQIPDDEASKKKYAGKLLNEGLDFNNKTEYNLRQALKVVLQEKYNLLGAEQLAEKNRWKDTTKKATDVGTKVHKYKEDSLKEIGIDLSLFGLDVKVIDLVNDIDDLSKLQDGVYPELMVWNNQFKIAGISDKITIETIGNKRFVDIDDYKTYKKVDTTSYLNKATGEYKKMLHPIHHLQDSNYIHASLQLSMYGYFLECFGFTIRNIKFTHIIMDADKTKILGEQPYHCKYLKEECISILQHYAK